MISISDAINLGKLFHKGFEAYHNWRQKKNVQEENLIQTLPQRFIQIYKAHGIERTQIPRFLGLNCGLTLDDLSSDEKLLKRLNEHLLQETCDRFGINREWLDGIKAAAIYGRYSFYQNLHGFFNFVVALKDKYDQIEAYAIKTPSDPLEKDKFPNRPIGLVFQIPIGELNNNIVYRYFPIRDEWYWGYWRTRTQFKAMTLICWQFKIYLAGIEVPEKDLRPIISGYAFPEEIMHNNSSITWHPDDYIFTHDEGGSVKDANEALEVRTMMTEHNILQPLLDKTGTIKLPRFSAFWRIN